jgi:hypothetical protein
VSSPQGPRALRPAAHGSSPPARLHTVTPAGADYGDSHDLSLRAATDRSLIADDGLHPSGAQYALWVELGR